MNPTPGILFIIDGTVKCAEREMPKADWENGFRGGPKYEQALKSWLKDCKDVVNIRSSWGKMKLVIDNRFYDINDMFQFKSGQKCLKVPEGEGVRVIKLL